MLSCRNDNYLVQGNRRSNNNWRIIWKDCLECDQEDERSDGTLSLLTDLLAENVVVIVSHEIRTGNDEVMIQVNQQSWSHFKLYCSQPFQ